MKKFLLCILITLFAAPLYAVDYVPGDVIVVLKPESSTGQVSASGLLGMGREAFYAASFASSSGAWVKNTYGSLSESSNNIYALIHSDAKTPDELTAELLKNPEVLAASPNYMFRAAYVPDDTSFGRCWGMNYINAPDAWDISTGSRSVYVAIIDSGIDSTNPDLAANIAGTYAKNTAYGDDYSAEDDFGHGTHVAGTIGAVGDNSLGVAGVNWRVRMISIKALDATGYGSYANVIDALNYVIELINSGVNIKVVNMSLEAYIQLAPTYENLVTFPLWRAFKALDDLNEAVIVVAAGNAGVTVGVPTSRKTSDYAKGAYVYPASFTGLNNMISVGAIDSDGNIASFSNKGADILAPGVDILSTWLQKASGYITSDGVSLREAKGTSMAAPHASGAAALLSAINPDLTAYQMKTAIINGSTNGILDLTGAIEYMNANTEAPEENTSPNEYDNYSDYEAVEPVTYEYGSETTHTAYDDIGQCRGFTLNIFALLLMMPLARKFMC